jgi:coenzyme PQQ synthesis protein D (PqqD)
MLEGFAAAGEVLRPDPNVIAERVHEDLVLVHLGTNRIYSLNSTAARVWELLSESLSVSGIQATLRAEFDVDDGQLSSEIEELLASLSVEQLIGPAAA